MSKLGHSFMLLCPSPAPLRHFIHREAQTHNIQLEPYFYQYVDITPNSPGASPITSGPATLEDMCACIPPSTLSLLLYYPSPLSLLLLLGNVVNSLPLLVFSGNYLHPQSLLLHRNCHQPLFHMSGISWTHCNSNSREFCNTSDDTCTYIDACVYVCCTYST